MPAGRPSTYTEEIAIELCRGLAEGKSLRTVCAPDHMPAISTFFKWLREHEEFSKQYAIAKDECADLMVEEIVEIADNQVGNPLIVEDEPLLIDGKPVMVVDGPAVNHARLRVDARKWAASKLKPKKYGEKVTQEHTSPGGGPVHVITSSMTAEEAAKLYKELME